MKGCSGVKKVAKGATQVAFKAAKKTVETVTTVFKAITKIITSVLGAFALDMSLETKLDKEEFNLAADFYLKAGPLQVRFAFKFNFKLAKLIDIVKMLFNKVKDFMLSKVPGLKKLL